VALTALDTLIVLGLKGKGFRQVEAIVLGLILTVAICLFTELVLVKPDWQAVAAGWCRRSARCRRASRCTWPSASSARR
jgi:Mn2+/Fe2+ NRAMP family transporter